MNWTTSPPAQPGWYWRRFVGNVIPTVIHVRQVGHVLVAEDGPLSRCDFEWGDRPIEEPEEPEKPRRLVDILAGMVNHPRQADKITVNP